MPIYSIAPQALFKSLWKHRELLWMLTKREVLGRYRGATMGLLWALLSPLAMLAIYTFVHSVVFKAQWSDGSASRTEFTLALYIGLLLFNLFAECINRAPKLIVDNMNYVKKVIFPLEILPWVTFFAALFHFVIGLGMWMLFFVVLHGVPSRSALLLIIVLPPLAGCTVGLTYLLSMIGVCLRDLSQVVTILTTILFYLSPIIYPVTALPIAYQKLVYLNPLTLIIEQARALLMYGHSPDFTMVVISYGCGLFSLWVGFSGFQRTRRIFADVL